MGLREIERLSPCAKESRLHWASRGGLCDGGNTNQPHSQVAAAFWELGEPEGAWEPGEPGSQGNLGAWGARMAGPCPSAGGLAG